MPVFLIQAKPHKTCVVRSGSRPDGGFLAPRVSSSQLQSVSGIKTKSGSGMILLGLSQVSRMEQNVQCVHPAVLKGVACLSQPDATSPYRTLAGVSQA